MPITLNPGIQRLQLQHNNIQAVDAALGFYAQLQYVDLSHNQLISLPDRGFIQQKKLVELDLSKNKIVKVLNGTFDGLKNIYSLINSGKLLKVSHGGLFFHIKSAQQLDLRQNTIKPINQLRLLAWISSVFYFLTSIT